MISENPLRHVRIIVYGKVQGVFFRKHTFQKANELGIKGFVKNQEDKSVMIEAVGNNVSLNFFIDWCKKGPSRANVTGVEIIELSNINEFSDFSILK